MSQPYAGQWGANTRAVEDKIVIDTCYLRVTYQFDFATDTLGTRKQDLQSLNVGRHCAHFYSILADQIDSAAYRNRQKKGNARIDDDINPYEWLGNTRQGRYEDVYSDYPMRGMMRVVSRFLSTDYIYSQVEDKSMWDYNGVEIQKVLGYTCLKATARLYGRQWEVWYTPEIGTNYGPWKFWGLPGLILSARDVDGLFQWTAIGIEQPHEACLYTYKSYEKCHPVKRRDVLRLQTQKWKDPIGFQLSQGVKGVTLVDKAGRAHIGVPGEYSMPYIPSLELE